VSATFLMVWQSYPAEDSLESPYAIHVRGFMPAKNSQLSKQCTRSPATSLSVYRQVLLRARI